MVSNSPKDCGEYASDASGCPIPPDRPTRWIDSPLPITAKINQCAAVSIRGDRKRPDSNTRQPAHHIRATDVPDMLDARLLDPSGEFPIPDTGLTEGDQPITDQARLDPIQSGDARCCTTEAMPAENDWLINFDQRRSDSPPDLEQVREESGMNSTDRVRDQAASNIGTHIVEIIGAGKCHHALVFSLDQYRACVRGTVDPHARSVAIRDQLSIAIAQQC